MNKFTGLFVVGALAALAYACSDSTAPTTVGPCTDAIDSAVVVMGTPVHSDTVKVTDSTTHVWTQTATFKWVTLRPHHSSLKTTSAFVWKLHSTACNITTHTTDD
jgi:hypothetical protein